MKWSNILWDHTQWNKTERREKIENRRNEMSEASLKALQISNEIDFRFICTNRE